MTLEEIERRVNKIKSVQVDDEEAHCQEDSLREDFIKYVASLDRLPHLARKAELVLSTNELDFARWCA